MATEQVQKEDTQDVHECDGCGLTHHEKYMRVLIRGLECLLLCMECAEFSIREQKERWQS